MFNDAAQGEVLTNNQTSLQSQVSPPSQTPTPSSPKPPEATSVHPTPNRTMKKDPWAVEKEKENPQKATSAIRVIEGIERSRTLMAKILEQSHKDLEMQAKGIEDGRVHERHVVG